jgi:CDP-diacylglycerol--glycerol-3-phosphate 3-phosphatidyltransferase
VARARLTKKRLVGLDRSGGPPPETQRGAPLNPWTIPNAVSFVRIAALPVFIVLALNSDDGRDTLGTVIYAAVAWGDQLDGFLARVTGQYSRLGALLDPLTDRLLVVSGVIVCWKFELLPRWALAVLVAREVVMLVLTQAALRRGMDLDIKMVGRWAVWPVMSAIGIVLIFGKTWVANVSLYVGIALTLWATVLYMRDGLHELRKHSSSA